MPISIPGIDTSEVGHAQESVVDLSTEISAVNELESLATIIPQVVQIQQHDYDANLSLEEKSRATVPWRRRESGNTSNSKQKGVD